MTKTDLSVWKNDPVTLEIFAHLLAWKGTSKDIVDSGTLIYDPLMAQKAAYHIGHMAGIDRILFFEVEDEDTNKDESTWAQNTD